MFSEFSSKQFGSLCLQERVLGGLIQQFNGELIRQFSASIWLSYLTVAEQCKITL